MGGLKCCPNRPASSSFRRVCVLGIQRGRCACIEGTEERMCVHCGEYVYLHASGAHVYIGGTKGIDIARFPSQFTDQDSLTT